MLSEIKIAHSKIEMLIRAQTRMLDYFDAYDIDGLYEETYFRFYIYGAFDAATLSYGYNIRKKIGMPLIRVGLTKYLSEEFTYGNQAGARDSANEIIEECLGLPDLITNRSVIEGGADGLAFLTGKPTEQGGLLIHFGSNYSTVGQQQVEGFAEFVAKDELRLRDFRKG